MRPDFLRLKAAVADANGGFRVAHGAPLGLVMDVRAADDRSLVSDWDPPVHAEGPPGVIHGGVQAYLADAMAGYSTVDHEARKGEAMLRFLATVDMRLRFRAPLVMGTSVRLTSRVAADDGRRVTAHVLLGQDGRADCTEADIVYHMFEKPWMANPYSDGA